MTAGSLDAIVDRLPLDALEPSKIPWQDPEFSQRMLGEHLDQRHDHASRRLQTIAAHAEWLFHSMLAGLPGSVLDLGCGPGLYTERLAARGCSCLGIDISPASIAYARRVASEKDLDCTYVLGDVTDTELGSGHDLAMLLFGEFNTFRPADIPALLRKTHAALNPGGRLVLEVHTHESVEREGLAPATWWSSSGGLYAPGPHIVLHEQQWIEQSSTTAARVLVIDADTARVETYSETLTAYTDDQYRKLLEDAGFTQVEFQSGFGGEGQPDFEIIVSRSGPEAVEGKSLDRRLRKR